MNEYEFEDFKKTHGVRKGIRGKNKNPTLVGTSIRLDQEVVDFFKKTYGSKMQAKMREVLSQYVANQKQLDLFKV